MLGLKTQESEKFNRFWEVIQATAMSEEKKFFADCGEGRDFVNDTMEGEDIRGWLIPKYLSEEFKKEWLKNNVSDKWIDYIYWAEWTDTNGIITIEFNTY